MIRQDVMSACSTMQSTHAFPSTEIHSRQGINMDNACIYRNEFMEETNLKH